MLGWLIDRLLGINQIGIIIGAFVGGMISYQFLVRAALPEIRLILKARVSAVSK
jgi:homoserine acetyltransferase